MIINKIAEKIESQYLDLLKLIDSGEYRIAIDGAKYGFKGWIERYTFDDIDNSGILTSMYYKDFMRIQVSFKNDLNDENIDVIYKMIKDILQRERKPVDIWLYNENHHLVDSLIKRFNVPLNDVYMSRELMYLKEPLIIDIKPLIAVPYSESLLIDTLYLLEDSFKRIALPNDFINNKDEYHKKFSNTDHSRYTGFLLNNELIGMYFHHDGEIEYIGVKSKYQSKGYGKLILHHALREIKEDSNNVPYLYCVDVNDRALNFYLREGFEVKAHSARL